MNDQQVPAGRDTSTVRETRGAPPRYFLHVILFMATFFTTTATGAMFVHPDTIRPISDGLSYSLPLLLILVFHEAGHYFAARLHGEPASLPYFIPLPPGLGMFGTMGAVIGMSSMTPNRRKLIDIGAAGPLLGLAVALPVLFYGLSLSEVKPLAGVGMQEGNSLLYALMKHAVKGEWLPGNGRDVNLHPTAWAGWAGLLITMLNLMPIGQLDGGHIATAYFGQRYGRISRMVHLSILGLAVLAFALVYVQVQADTHGRALPEGLTVFQIAMNPAMSWFIWFGLLWFLRRGSRGQDHPPVDDMPLPRSRMVLFWAVVVMFFLIFMPVPLRITVGSADAGGALSRPPSSATP